MGEFRKLSYKFIQINNNIIKIKINPIIHITFLKWRGTGKKYFISPSHFRLFYAKIK